MEVMLEIYNTLKTLGMEWKEKGGIWGGQPHMNGNGHGHSEQGDEGDGEGDDIDARENTDVYFVQTRWRVRDVVVSVFLLAAYRIMLMFSVGFSGPHGSPALPSSSGLIPRRLPKRRSLQRLHLPHRLIPI